MQIAEEDSSFYFRDVSMWCKYYVVTRSRYSWVSRRAITEIDWKIREHKLVQRATSTPSSRKVAQLTYP